MGGHMIQSQRLKNKRGFFFLFIIDVITSDEIANWKVHFISQFFNPYITFRLAVVAQ